MLKRLARTISNFWDKVFDVSMMKMDLDHLRSQNDRLRQELADKAMSEVFVEEDVNKIYTEAIVRMSNERLAQNELLSAQVQELRTENEILARGLKESHAEATALKERCAALDVENQRFFDEILNSNDIIEGLKNEVDDLTAKSKPRKRTGNSKT